MSTRPAAGRSGPSLAGPRRVRFGPRTAAVVVAAALVALAGASLVAASSLATSGARRIGADVPVDRAVAGDVLRFDANNSPSLARSPVDPARMAVANRIDAPRFGCALHVSSDGGATWQPSAIPFPAGEENPPRCFAPDVAFGADGTLHVLFATLYGSGNRPHAVWLSSSTDGGKTLSEPRRVLGELSFQARLAADPAVPARLYVTWLQATDTAYLAFPTTGNPIELARSDDGGRTWTDPVRVSPGTRQRVVAPALRAGPKGRLYLSYLDLGDDRLDYDGGHQGRGGPAYAGAWSLVLARSGDDGRTWSESVVADDIAPPERFVVFLPPTPSLAVDPAGRHVYLAFHSARSGDADVFAWSSGDGGRTFLRRRVNDTPARDGRDQYLPQLSLAGDGRLDVVYYDRRADPRNGRNGVSLQSSTDGGRSFARHVAVSNRSFDAGIGFGSERGMADLGSRLALVSARHSVLAVWPDTRAGTQGTSKQDLAQAVVRIDEASAWAPPLRALGVVLLLAAVVAVAATRRRPS
ncbi:MAG TPA: sialidase family protein [Acidimicrobiales bacterium]|nr:sialidase family protein [Acidimicrobiales bacterium]